MLTPCFWQHACSVSWHMYELKLMEAQRGHMSFFRHRGLLLLEVIKIMSKVIKRKRHHNGQLIPLSTAQICLVVRHHTSCLEFLPLSSRLPIPPSAFVKLACTEGNYWCVFRVHDYVNFSIWKCAWMKDYFFVLQNARLFLLSIIYIMYGNM